MAFNPKVIAYVLLGVHSCCFSISLCQFEISGLESRARTILKGVGFKESTTLHKSYSSLSGGWRMRCHLASVLYRSPNADIIILDEPTNFLDLLGIVWLQRYLTELRASVTVLIVSHDRDFLDSVCEETIILRDQKLTYFRGNVSAYAADFESKKLNLSAMKEAQDRQIKHMKNSIAENIKDGKKSGDDNKLRLAKSRQKKVDERMGLQVSATGGRFKLNRDRPGFQNTLRAEIEVPTDEKGVAMVFPRAQELPYPGSLVSLEKATFQYGGKAKPKASALAILQDVDLVVHMGDRVGIVGLNGSGKTTLINLLTSITKPTQGIASRHPRLQLGYYSQLAVEDLQEASNEDRTLTALSLLLKDAEGALSEPEVRALLGSLGLQGRIASDVPIGSLSGGQLVRLALARIIWKSPHLLVLDEISTHLDFYTVSALVEALEDFEGAVVVVSHDRFLIRCGVQGESQTGEANGDVELREIDERRRVVYSLKGGKLHELAGGVKEFEASLERRIDKLFAHG
jgi:ATPase subunit of ABC transporter with duplicated ATPase domains